MYFKKLPSSISFKCNRNYHRYKWKLFKGRTVFKFPADRCYCTQKEWGGGAPLLKTARILLGGLTWVMSTSCLPSLVAAFFWALVGVWSVLELTSDEMLELPLPAKGERGGEGGREGERERTNMSISSEIERPSISEPGTIPGSFKLSLKQLMFILYTPGQELTAL